MYRHAVGPRVLNRLDPTTSAPQYSRICVEPLGVTLGAHIKDIDLRQPIDEMTFAELRVAFFEWKVLVFENQPLDRAQFHNFASLWGKAIDDSILQQVRTGGAVRGQESPIDNVTVYSRDATAKGYENVWHTDGSFRKWPALGAMLKAVEVPDVGGDTMFADMAAAYDNLPDGVKSRTEGLSAIHDWAMGYGHSYIGRESEFNKLIPPQTHPIVRLHPHTGRKTLYVNKCFVREIVGLPQSESDELLDVLCRQAGVPEYQYRVRWKQDTLVFWDNYAVQHYAVNDTGTSTRTMMRISIAPPGEGLKSRPQSRRGNSIYMIDRPQGLTGPT